MSGVASSSARRYLAGMNGTPSPIPSIALGILVGLSLPALLASTPTPPGTLPGRVYLIRGQGYVFSTGWRTLRDRLRSAGIRAEDVSDLSAGWTVEDVLADHRAGRLAGPIVFVGHSRGGRQALLAASRLGQEGINVDLLLTTDVAIPPAVPANVRRAVNLYLKKNRLYPARSLSRAPDSESTIDNIVLDDPHSPISARGLHHLNITDSPEVQDYLFDQIVNLFNRE